MVRQQGVEERDIASVPTVYFPVEIAYTTVHKERVQGRVVSVEQRIVLCSQQQVEAVLAEGNTAPTINVSYVERWNGTQRRFNARKARKVLLLTWPVGPWGPDAVVGIATVRPSLLTPEGVTE